MDRPAYLPARGRGRGRGNRGGYSQPSAWAGGAPSFNQNQNQNQHNQQKQRNQQHGQNNYARQPSNDTVSAEERFQDAAAKHQQQAQKHLQDNTAANQSQSTTDDGEDPYVSSEEEDELNNDGIMDGLLQQFKTSDQEENELGSTKDYLMNSLKSKANVCLICIETIKKADPIWSCKGCYSMFHIPCIQKWVKDGVYQQTALSDDNFPAKDMPWLCPKCRRDYSQLECPRRYHCFCGKEEDPVFDPWLVPHSCGAQCGKKLQPECGHSCLLLCHPGPCPPCPQMVRVGCHCGRGAIRTTRCGPKGVWSCGEVCGKGLDCAGGHSCQKPCHPTPCPPCPNIGNMPCACGNQTMRKKCAESLWHCEKVCRRPLSCGNHLCEKVCHGGVCGDCPRAGKRVCPCGKSEFSIPCTEDVPTCMDTCSKLLECGKHRCTQRCHTGPCGTCRQMTTKTCRCGKNSKEIQCYKEYLCQSKCMNMKDCTRHACKRKCCDGNCPPCEEQCGKKLGCGNHKCASGCHRGRCYPCTNTVTLSCRCEGTTITLPCGREKVSKPPKCNLKCKLPPDCHHPARSEHRCHFNRCPPCRHPCGQMMSCKHVCQVQCHDAVLTRQQPTKERAGPWEAVEIIEKLQQKPCPPCQVPIAVTCPGQHETVTLPCFNSAVKSCQRKCGRQLACTNHTCQLECHEVNDAPGPNMAGSSCQECEEGCSKPRPEGCRHSCLSVACHPDDCPPCSLMVRMRCHCSLILRHIECDTWTHADDTERDRLKSCSSRCPKLLSCHHQCIKLCHPGACPPPLQCTEKVKVRCPCRRRKADFLCNQLTGGECEVECDDACLAALEVKKKEKEEQERIKKEEELKKQQQEIEEYERKMGKRKRKPRKVKVEEVKPTLMQKYGMILIGPFLAVIFSVFVYYLFMAS